jgi:GAF domain-containing protein
MISDTPDPADDDACPDAARAELFMLTGAGPSAAGEVSVSRSIRELLQLVREQMSLDIVFVGEIVKDRRVFRYIDSGVKPARITEGDSNPLDQTLCQRILDGRVPPLIPDVSTLVGSQGLPANFLDVGTYIGVPVRLRDGTVYGFLCGYNLLGRCSDLDSRDVKRMEIAANVAARMLERAHGSDHPPSDHAPI